MYNNNPANTENRNTDHRKYAGMTKAHWMFVGICMIAAWFIMGQMGY